MGCSCDVNILGAQYHIVCADSATDAADNTAADTEALGGVKTKAAVDALLGQLPKCISRDLCDELSINFCYLNSKAARKRLVRTLCESSHRSNLQLLPFYCRVAAILSQVFPDVGAAVLKAQEDEFNYLQVSFPLLLSTQLALANCSSCQMISFLSDVMLQSQVTAYGLRLYADKLPGMHSACWGLKPYSSKDAGLCSLQH